LDIIPFILPFLLFLIPLIFKTSEDQEGKQKKKLNSISYLLIVLFLLAQGYSYWKFLNDEKEAKSKQVVEQTRFTNDSLRLIQIINSQGVAINQLQVLDTAAKNINSTVDNIVTYNNQLLDENRILRNKILQLNEEVQESKYSLPNEIFISCSFKINLKNDKDFTDSIESLQFDKRAEFLQSWLISNYAHLDLELWFLSDEFTQKKREQWKEMLGEDFNLMANQFTIKYSSENIFNEAKLVSILKKKRGWNELKLTYYKNTITVVLSNLPLPIIENRASITSLLELCNGNMFVRLERKKSTGWTKPRYIELNNQKVELNTKTNVKAKLITDDYPSSGLYFRLESNCWNQE